MIRLFFLLLLCSLQVHAAFERPVITHSKLIPRTMLRTGFWGYLDVVGNFDKIVDNRVEVIGTFQYRIGEGAWANVGGPAEGRAWMVSRGVNSRRIDFSNMTGASFDLRVCIENNCSVPYVVYFTPKFTRIISPENGVITKFKRSLRVGILHHNLGGVVFHIGKLDPYPGSPTTEIYYSGKEEVVVANCPQESPNDIAACEVPIPDSIMEKPGRYALTMISSLGSSVNFLPFDVSEGYKIINIYPPRIQSPIQDLITVQVADEDLTTRAIHVNMVYPCAGHPIQVQGAGTDKLLLKVPPNCMPNSGCGDMEMDVQTPGGVERIKIPFSM